jgi:pilus assembly protein CpaB
MRLRTLILFAIALVLAGGTAILVRSWLSQQPAVAAVAPPPRQAPQKSIMVARAAIARGQILKPADLNAQPWPDAAITGDYVIAGTGPAKSLVNAVAREPIAAGEPIIKTKIVVPGDRGFLAAVLQPGMRAVSVPVDATTDVSGFVFAGDRVDILISLPVPQDGANGNSGYQHKAAETVLHDVRVIAIDQHLDSKDGQAVVARNVTFEVTPKQSEIIAVASEIGKLSLSLRGLAVVKGQKSAVVAAADSHDDPGLRNFTLDSEVSQVLPKPFTSKQNPNDGMVTILRGNGNNGTSVSSQPASRGS